MSDKKNNTQEKENYDIEYDNLAMPEIHTHRAEHKQPSEPAEESVTYDTLAIPEIHIRKKKPQ